MAGELLTQVLDLGRFRAIRPALDELNAARTLSAESREVLREVAASPWAREDLGGFVARMLRHPELELRVFLAPGAVNLVIEKVVHLLCFENGAEFSLVTPVGPNWVVLDCALAVFTDLDWFRATFFRPSFYPGAEAHLLAYPRVGERRYYVLSREDVARVAAGTQLLSDDPIPTEVAALLATRAEQLHVREMTLFQEMRSAAQGLARLAAKALSRKELTLAHVSLL